MSQTVVASGPGHRLFLAVPRGAPPAAGWPILYLLDGNAAFDFLTPDHLAAVPGLMLAGIGYDTDRQFAREQRTLDFTAPEGPGDGIRPDPVHPGRLAGGAAQFLDRLTGPLRAAAEAAAPVDPTRRTLWGHSFGGLFTLYALLTRPGAFARFAAISPSIWWDEALIRRVADGAGRLASPPPLLVALGDREKRSGSDGPPPDGPAPATMRFVADLRDRNGLSPQVHVLPGLVHIQTIAGSLPLALPFAADAVPG
ncbi:alpha/beta hydrolase-fold protein [uncultured Paracoccus sp.]|uniref:alpha/beta hydrolase n=1 Tax=uncultured Paracoccus sp. TaxID=189685 RepID=UPI0025ED00F3|nr:alpha/beta hydrolase-fold protein [uncultured Paracoccus sp.]